MSAPRAAPLATFCHDILCAWLGQDHTQPAIQAVLDRAWRLQDAIHEALSLPDDRRAALRAADAAVCGLKAAVRVAGSTQAVTPGFARAQGELLVDVGRMLGGWRRREAGRRTEAQ